MKRLSLRPGSAARWTTIAVAAAVLLAVPVVAQIQFSDVPDNDPHRRDINFVAGERWFVGYRDGTYKPDQEISPSEMTRVLTRAFDEGLTRAEFASFMVGGNEWQKRVKQPFAKNWDPGGEGNEAGFTWTYAVGYHPERTWWTDEDGNPWMEPGQYRIEGIADRDGGSGFSRTRDTCRWMRLGHIPVGGQNFSTIAATDAPLAGDIQLELTSEPTIITIEPTDTAFMIQCAPPCVSYCNRDRVAVPDPTRS